MDFDYTKEPGRKLLNRELNNEGEPLVSIITPFYNAGKYFEQTYNCVMNQTFPWFEWIIVNDGSTNEDDVVILNNIEKTDSRITVIHKENGGSSSARNVAIKSTCTDIIVTLDADDLIDPTYVECLYWGLFYNPEASWCYTRSIGFEKQEYIWNRPFDIELLKTYNFLNYTAAIRKNDLLQVGIYDEITRYYYEDWRLWLKLLSASKMPIKLGYYGFWYRRLDNGALSTINKDPKMVGIAKKLIEEVAESVDTTIKAKEYPCNQEFNKFSKPKKSNWDRKTFKEHNKINVMMLIPWMEMGGADLFNLDIVNKIDKEKYEISILTTVTAENTWRQLFEEHVADIFDLTSFLDVENYAEFISYFIKSREIDVVFLSNSYYGYYLMPWIRKEFMDVAILDYVHMEEWYWRNGGYARTSGVVGGILEKTYVCNERTRQVLINQFNRNSDSIETLYIGVDKDKFDRSKIEKGIAKAELGIDEERPVILFPCRIHPQKRPFLMVEIAKELKTKINNIVVVVVGDGPQLDELKQKVQEYSLEKTIYFAGRKADMRSYYRDSDITLICSIKEGLALTAYESLSMGVPVVSSNVGGQKELIDEKVGAILPLMQKEASDFDIRNFDKKEINQYVTAIEKLLEDKGKYEEISLNCRKRIIERFSSDIMIDKLQSEIDHIVKDKEIQYKRKELNKTLNLIPNMVDDYCTIFSEYESKNTEINEVWKSREWFRKLYEESLTNTNKTIKHCNINESDVQNELNKIYSMRSWKLIQNYRNFMDNTFIGKKLRKIMDILL